MTNTEIQLEQMERMIGSIDQSFNEGIKDLCQDDQEIYQKVVNLIKIALDRNALFFEYMNIKEDNEEHIANLSRLAESKIKRLILPN